MAPKVLGTMTHDCNFHFHNLLVYLFILFEALATNLKSTIIKDNISCTYTDWRSGIIITSTVSNNQHLLLSLKEEILAILVTLCSVLCEVITATILREIFHWLKWSVVYQSQSITFCEKMITVIMNMIIDNTLIIWWFMYVPGNNLTY